MLLFKRVIREFTEFNWGIYMRQKKINSGLYKFEDFIDIPPILPKCYSRSVTPKNGGKQPANTR